MSGVGEGPLSRAEALANEALQKSNLGRYAEADSLFIRAAEQLGNDPLVARRLRNYRAIHQLNQGKADAALQELDKPVPKAAGEVDAATGRVIDPVAAKRLNSETKLGQQLNAQSDELLPAEKAAILDGQALQLRGTSLRLKGDLAQAATALRSADAKLEAIRNGRVASVIWMRAQILGDLAAIAEDQKDTGEADALYRQGVALVEANYPGSAALLNAKARLAGYLARTGQRATARGHVPRDRPLAARHQQPAAVVRATSFALCRPAADKRGDAAANRRDFRGDPADGPSRPCADPGGPRPRAQRRDRRRVAPVPPVGDAHPPGRARPDRARAACPTSPSPTPDDAGTRLRMVKAALDSSQKEQLATQSALGELPALPGGVRRGDSARRSPEDASSRAKPITG